MVDDELLRQEETELVDVSEVSEAIPEPTVEARETEASDQIYLERRATVANLRERFAAFFIDTLILAYSFFVIGALARRVFYHTWNGPIPVFGWQGAAFFGILAFYCFMYYFIFEGIFFATPGKFFCWMSVRRKDGRLASMSAIFLRNVFRPIDYALPFLPFFCMELTSRKQRFGDIVSGTTVIKKHMMENAHYSITASNMVSASGRVLSFLIDLIILGSLAFGYSLLLSPDDAAISRWLLIVSPMVPFLYFVVTEPMAHATPGKWVFGYAIAHDDGTPVSFSGSVIRTLYRLFDTNMIGLIAVWISPKKQRFGDLAADTMVTKQPRRWQGAVALGGWVILAATTLWFGLHNNSSYLHSKFKFNFAPAIEGIGQPVEDTQSKQLEIKHVRFASDEAHVVRTPPVFQAGETVYVISEVYGYQRSGRMVWLQEDIDVRYPDASIGLHQENVIDYHQVVESTGPVELTNSVKLPDNAQGGTYTVTISIRDLFARENTTAKQTFEVKAPAQQPSPQPAPEQAPAPVAPPVTAAPSPAPAPAAPPAAQQPQESSTIPIPSYRSPAAQKPAVPSAPSLNAPPPGTTVPPPKDSPELPKGGPNI